MKRTNKYKFLESIMVEGMTFNAYESPEGMYCVSWPGQDYVVGNVFANCVKELKFQVSLVLVGRR